MQVAAPSVCTYISILLECCHRARRPDLGLAFFSRILDDATASALAELARLLVVVGAPETRPLGDG
jgi:hypothetical protein